MLGPRRDRFLPTSRYALELRSQREVQDTHKEARMKRCHMFWGVLDGLQARLCKSRGVSTERQSGHSRDTGCSAHVTAFYTLLCIGSFFPI